MGKVVTCEAHKSRWFGYGETARCEQLFTGKMVVEVWQGGDALRRRMVELQYGWRTSVQSGKGAKDA